MNTKQTIIIGGFALNRRPLAKLLTQLNNYSFIDINAFSAPFSLEEIAQQLVDGFKLRANSLHLIAYSCGGLLALTLAKLIPQWITSVTLINSSPCFMQQEHWQGIAHDNLHLLQQRLTRASLNNFLNYFTQLAAQPVPLPRNELSAWQSEACNQATLCQWLQIIAQTDLRKLILTLTPHLIWLNAEYDQLIPYPQQNPQAQILRVSSHLELDAQQLLAQIKPYL